MWDELQERWGDIDLDELVHRLGSEKSRDAKRALKMFRTLTNDQVVDLCLEIAGSIRESNRHTALNGRKILQFGAACQAAREIAGEYLSKSYIAELLSRFESAADSELRINERKLDALQLGSVYKSVHKVLVSTKKEHITAACLRIIGGSGNPKAGKIVTPYLGHNATQVRVAALVSIFSLKLKADLPRVNELLLDPAGEVRSTAVNVLSAFKSNPTVLAKPARPRDRIAFHIASSPTKELIVKLWPETRCIYYDHFKQTQQIQFLIESASELSDFYEEAIQHPDPLVRSSLAVILGTISEFPPYILLQKLLDDEVVIVKANAVLALTRLFRVQQDFDHDLLQRIQEQGEVCLPVFSNWYHASFGHPKTSHDIPGAESGLQVLILEAMGCIGSDQAAEFVIAKLKILKQESRELNATGFNKSDEVKSKLDSNRELQHYCWIALARIGNERSKGELISYFDFESLSKLTEDDREKSRKFSHNQLRNPFGGVTDGCSMELTLVDSMILNRAIPTLVAYLTSLHPRYRFPAVTILKELAWEPNSQLECACWWASQSPNHIEKLQQCGAGGENVLRKLLESLDPEVYFISARMLAKCGAETRSDDERIAHALVRRDFLGLEEFQEKAQSAIFRFAQYLLKFDSDEFEKVRPSLVQYLNQLNPNAASQATIEYLLTGDRIDRRAIGTSLTMQVLYSQRNCAAVWQLLAQPDMEWGADCLEQLQHSSAKAIREDRDKLILKNIANAVIQRGGTESVNQIYELWLKTSDCEESDYHSHTGYNYQNSYRESLLKSLRRVGDVRIFDDLVRRLKIVPHAKYELEEFTLFFEAARKSLSYEQLNRLHELESGKQWDEDKWFEEYRGHQNEWRMLTVDYARLRELAGHELDTR